MQPLFDFRQPGPLLFAAALHIGALWLLQSGLHPSAPVPLEMKEVVGFLVPPQPKPVMVPPVPVQNPVAAPEPPMESEPTPVAPPIPEKTPPKKKPVKKPVKEPSKEPHKAGPKATSITPSDKAVQVAESEPVPPAPVESPSRPAAPVPAPLPAAPTAPPAPVEAPRFDAAYLNNPPPAYPPLSRRMGEEGRVVLRVQVTATGEAGEVRIQTSSGFPRLDEAASNAVRSWRFVPATQGGKAVAASVLVPLNFRLDQ